MEALRPHVVRERARGTGNPLEGIGPLRVLWAGELLDGPLWNAATGTLLFSEVGADAILELRLPDRVKVRRRPSNRACAMAWSPAGELLVAEGGSRRITRTRPDGTIETLASRFEGHRLNSPNDLAVHPAGSIYFSDPPFGLTGNASSELGFNGLFRITPEGRLVLEWWGRDALPNGVALCPDLSALFVSDTERNEIRRHFVLCDGSLAAPEIFCEVDCPDGMCLDGHANLFVAAEGGVHVFSPDGMRLGLIELDDGPTHVTFGGPARRTLFVTTAERLYAVDLAETWLEAEA